MTTMYAETERSTAVRISVDDVTFGYGDVPVLDSVSLDVEPGTFLGLVGPNRSGKSTLLNPMLGLRRPDKGTVSLFGEPAHEFDAGDRIEYVAQDTTKAARDIPVTVREVVEMSRYPRRLVGRFSTVDRRAAEETLKQVGITDLASRRVSRLSDGQRQRVFIARALASEVDLLGARRIDGRSGCGVERRLLRPPVRTGRDRPDRPPDRTRHRRHHIRYRSRVSEPSVVLRRGPSEFVETDVLAQASGTDQHVLQHDH